MPIVVAIRTDTKIDLLWESIRLEQLIETLVNNNELVIEEVLAYLYRIVAYLPKILSGGAIGRLCQMERLPATGALPCSARRSDMIASKNTVKDARLNNFLQSI